MTSPLGVALRALDRGRLHAPAVIEIVDWDPGIALEADVSRPHRLRLRPRRGHAGPVVASRRVHVDGTGRVMLTRDIREHLVVGQSDSVLVWAERDGAGNATGVLAVANPAIIERGLVALAAFEDAEMRLPTPGLTVIGEVG